MKMDWKQFLVDKGAEFDGDYLTSFGHSDRERRIPPQGAILCDLSHKGVISATGTDAQNFLQGQLSNDIAQVSATQSQLSSYNSPKGRVYTTFHIFQRDGVYYLSLAADMLEPMLKRLRMFVMRSDVAMEDASESLVHFGYADPRGEQRLKDAIGAYPENDLDVLQINQLTIIRQPGSVPRFEVFGELDAARDLWTQLSVHAAAVGPSSWDYFNLEAGLPEINHTSSEAWVAQMINLQHLNAISFSKGCFPGQEVVARLKYLGKNKRQMYRLAIDTLDLPQIGDKVTSGSDEAAGAVVNACHNPDGTVEVLAVMKITAMANENLSINGAAATSLTLPYAIDSE